MILSMWDGSKKSWSHYTVEDVVKILVWMGFIPGVRGVEMIPKRKAIIVSKQRIFLGMSMILMRTLSCRNWILVTIDRAVCIAEVKRFLYPPLPKVR